MIGPKWHPVWWRFSNVFQNRTLVFRCWARERIVPFGRGLIRPWPSSRPRYQGSFLSMLSKRRDDAIGRIFLERTCPSPARMCRWLLVCRKILLGHNPWIDFDFGTFFSRYWAGERIVPGVRFLGMGLVPLWHRWIGDCLFATRYHLVQILLICSLVSKLPKVFIVSFVSLVNSTEWSGHWPEKVCEKACHLLKSMIVSVECSCEFL